MLNKVILIGNVGGDPEIREGRNGKRFASFSLATSKRWKDKNGEKQDKTEWHKVVCFNEHLLGPIEKYVEKGSKIYIEGEITTRKWEDDSGQTRYQTEIVLPAFTGTLLLLDKKESGGYGAPDSAYGEDDR